MRRLVLRICVGLMLAAGARIHASGVDFWVWHREKPLAAEERAALLAQGVTTLFWHVGEMENRAGKWSWKRGPRPLAGGAEGLRIVPVVRLTSEDRQPFAPAALEILRRELPRAAAAGGALQLDFDCPDRLLPDYAAALRELRKIIPHLSITALAQWPRVPAFAALAREVEEIAPMFYDLQADPTGVSAEAPPPPLLDPAQLAALLQPWKRCAIPWRAGLPAFARLTVFDRTGVSRGQIPNWEWDDFCFHKALHTLAPTRLGVTLFRAASDTRVAATPVRAGEIVASRFTDRAALAQAVELARAAGAAGVVLFRLPDGRAPGGASLGDMAALGSEEKPQLLLRATDGESFELHNDSAVDLAPRLSGEKSDRDRGYALEIDAPAPVFREALAGDFWRVTSHANPEAKEPAPVVVPLARRLTFWFSQLRGRAVLRTGLVQLEPETSRENLRYRILHADAASEWRPLPTPAALASP